MTEPNDWDPEENVVPQYFILGARLSQSCKDETESVLCSVKPAG